MPRRSRLIAPLFLAPAALLYGLFVIWPLVEVCRLSLFRWNGYGPRTFVGLANFASVFGDPLYRTSLWHSALWESGAIVIPSLVGLGIALVVERCPVPAGWRPLFLAAIFFPALLPPTVVAAIWVLLYSPVSGPFAGTGLDWLGDPHLALPGLFLAWMWSALGVGTLVFWAGLRAIGKEYLELAMVEGAGPLWLFLHVILPGLRRAGIVVALINAALAMGVFDLVFVTTGGGPGYATIIVPLDVYGRAFGGRTGEGAAAAMAQIALGLLLAGIAVLLLRRRDESLDTGNDAERDQGDTQRVTQRVPGVSRRPHGTALLSTSLLLAVLAGLLLPLGWLAVEALQPGYPAGGAGLGARLGLASPGSFGVLDPRHWTGDNIPAIWNAGMSGALTASVLLACAVTLATLLLAAPAAFALAHLVKGRGWVAVSLPLLVVGLLQPTPVLIIPLFSLLKDLSLLDTPWGIVLPEIARALPFAALVLWGFMAQSPREVLEAAAIDGASAPQRMLRVALPLIRPALYASAIWAFVTSWNEYLLPTLVSQDGSIGTVPTLLASFIGAYNTQYGLLAAGSLMAILPSLAIYLVLCHPAAAGVASGARSRLREDRR